MAPDSGASPALLEQMAERVAARTQYAEKVASGTTRRTSRRGDDGRVRVVKVQVEQGTVIRSVNKLCPLEGEMKIVPVKRKFISN